MQTVNQNQIRLVIVLKRLLKPVEISSRTVLYSDATKLRQIVKKF